ncbi:hypothetical protein TNCV_2896701 [Trichonephila clavipes]|nr:hypothetical protein TNCV_2896701 [Trichonephila clavipes]
MCTNCSSESASPAHQAGFRRRSLAGVGFLESVRSHGPGQALLTNGGVQQQQSPDKSDSIPFCSNTSLYTRV